MSSSHRDAHPYGRSNVDVRRRDARRRRQRRVRITQLIVFSVAMIGIVCALAYALRQLTEDGGTAAGPSDAGTSVPLGADGVQCPAPGSKPVAPEDVSVTVLNGTSRSGLAADVAGTLEDRGFDPGKAGNTKASSGPVTIVYGPSGYLAATSVAAEFDDPSLRLEEDREDSTVDVLIGDGFKDLRAKSKAAETRTKAAAVPSGCSGATTGASDGGAAG
ncbi:hypothetical protein DEO23_05875 [Brachybacterium endophyticum]|uniref:LytR/CpsA/Psr regulator C-terminal domain-containing protein n=1 Tax=Brachybacterium endophyticum TaxID=2182385 RepID=A0A2U2RL27_9MICO|nr:LytR C-terminal domain-containing protein [Brachybacterium endophyticum]PWH06495.1 hypothetical protein DEO23_05875 [Brachybacterium endophyticum]